MGMTVTVLGAAGGVGRAFAERLRAARLRVVGIDVREQPTARRLSRVIGDVRSPDTAVRAAISRADTILVCLPEHVAVASLPGWASAVRPGALIVDVLSVKSRFAAAAAACVPGAERLGVNPLFGPDLGFAGRTIAVARQSAGPRTEWFLTILRQWGLTLAEVTTDEHDRVMAIVQALTHSTLLAFGCALRDLACDEPVAAPLRTPVHTELLSLLARLVAGHPDVYFEIQRANPYAARAREALDRGVARVGAAVTAADPIAFERLLHDLRDIFGPELGEWSARARDRFEATRHDIAPVR
jgi:prephenate dehydrogenase